MPESPTVLPPVLRQGLSAHEQAVLTLGANGGGQRLMRELSGVKTPEQGEQMLADVREKAANLLNGARRATPARERSVFGRMANCGQHGEYTDRGRGCPACNTAQGGGERPKPAADAAPAREVPTPALSPSKRAAKPKGEPPPRRPRDVPAPARVQGEDRVPSEEDRTMVEGAAAAPPKMRAAAPESSSPPEADGPAPAAEPAPRRERPRGAVREELLRLLDENGPMRQADARKALRIGSPQMANLVHALSDRIEVGDVVERSPMLSIRKDVEDAGEEQQLEDADAGGDDAVEADAAPAGEAGAPEVERELTPPRPDPREHVLADVRRRMEESRREQSRIAHELAQLAGEMDEGVPEVILRARYLAALLKAIEGGDTSPELLDRFERLAGISAGD